MFRTIFYNFPYILFNTFQKKADSIYTGTPLHPLLWWLNKTYDNTGKLKGGDNILKERIRSNNNVFTYYVVLVTFSIKERMSITETDHLTWICTYQLKI
jgi:hypothetical protein